MADIKLQGVDALVGKLASVSKEMKFKGGRFALRKAANLVRDAAIMNARALDDPDTREDISKNVTVRFSTRTFKRTGDLKFRVGIMGGAAQYANTKDNVRARRAGKTYATGGSSANPGGDTWYWRLLEFGTQFIAARPFLRPAIENNAQAAIDTFARESERAIDRAVKRQGKL